MKLFEWLPPALYSLLVYAQPQLLSLRLMPAAPWDLTGRLQLHDLMHHAMMHYQPLESVIVCECGHCVIICHHR